MTRAAAALAWAIVSGMFLGPCAVPARNMPVRCVSTGLSLGWYSLMKPAAAVCRPATRAISAVPSLASRPAESTTRSNRSSILRPVKVSSKRTREALVRLLDDLADAAAHVAHAALLHEPVVLLVRLAGRAQVGVADGDLARRGSAA